MTERNRISCPACRHTFAPPQPPREALENPPGSTSDSTSPSDHALPDAPVTPPDPTPPWSDRARRGRRTGRGAALRISLVCLGLALGIAVLWALNRYLKPPTAPSRLVEAIAPEEDSNRPSLAQMVQTAERSVVVIESSSARGIASLGSGFVIDPEGLVATNYHVLAEATEARVRFQDGRTAAIAGYAAVDPEADLAIVQLEQIPEKLAAMRLKHDVDPDRLASVVTIGHPHGVNFTSVDGRVSRVLETAELPSHSQEFLLKLMGRSLQQEPLRQWWIQHTGRISEGNSGGPLLNRQGEVIGVNTWVDQQTRFGYALHARHLHRLQQNLSSQITPLTTHARHEARLVSFLERLTSQRLATLIESAEQMDWRPSSPEDYEVLQQLAWAATVTRMPSDFARQGVLDEQLPQLNQAIDQLVMTLRKQRWDGFGQITLINEWAGQRDRALEGSFFFAVVERVVEGERGGQGAIVRLPGLNRFFFLPLHPRIEVPPPESQCLILGVHNGHRVQFGQNPLNLHSAPVVAPGILIDLPQLEMDGP